jgi:hypothetical protein
VPAPRCSCAGPTSKVSWRALGIAAVLEAVEARGDGLGGDCRASACHRARSDADVLRRIIAGRSGAKAV